MSSCKSSETASSIVARLSAPMAELRFLLDHGYRRAHALRFVGEHHQLVQRDRNVLERVVFSEEDAARRRARVIGPDAVGGRHITVDGYNVLMSLVCLSLGEPLFLADDGVVRDVAAGRSLCSLQAARRALDLLIPALSVKGTDNHTFDRALVQTADIDVDAAWMRTRLIKRLDSAVLAEYVICNTGAESIGTETVFTLQQAELSFRNAHSQKAGFAAH